MTAARKTAHRFAQIAECPLEVELRRCHSLGELERLAGIGADHAERFAFWRPYARLPARESLDKGTAELRRLIRARYAAGALVLPEAA